MKAKTWIVLSLLLIGMFAIINFNSENASTITISDWVVVKKEVRENETIILNGNLIISNSGNLTLKNTTLKINSLQDRQFRIEVNGKFQILENSKITAFNQNYKFKFLVNSGSIFEMRNSELSYSDGLTIKTNNTIIQNNNIFNNLYGIFLYSSSNNSIENSKIFNSTNYDFYLDLNSKNNTAINTTFSKIFVSSNSELIIKNYLEVLVQDFNSYPIENAKVSVKDNNNEVFNSTTNSEGLISYIIIDRIYNENSNATENLTTVEVFYDNFTFANNPRNVNMSYSHKETFQSNEELLSDLTLNIEDISFSNENPIVGDEIKISAKIWNIGKVKAENILIKFYNNKTFIGEFLIEKIYKNSNEVSFIYWNSVYGNHKILVFIDEENKIKEINENNNFASKEIFVSAKQIQISISLSPKENFVDVEYEDGIAIINGEVFVNNIYKNTLIKLNASITKNWHFNLNIFQKELLSKNGISQSFSFTANITVPKWTSSLNPEKFTIFASVFIDGEYTLYTKAISTIFINQFFKLKVEKIGEQNYTFTEINQRKNYTFKITNLGNGIDTFLIEVPNLQELNKNGWGLTLSKVIIANLEPNETSTFTLTLYPVGYTPKNINDSIVILKITSSTSEEKIYSEISFNATYETKEKIQPIVIASPNYGIYIISAMMITLIILSLFFGTEVGRVNVLMLFSALMTRIRKDDALDNFLRGRLYEYIKSNPGVSFTDMLKTFEVGNGTLSYHLLILEKTEYIKSQNDGLYKRYYPTGMKIKAKDINFLSEIQKAILEKIKTNNGISQSKIANELGKSKRVVNYHINLLKEAEIVKVEKKGFEARCYMNE